MEFILPAIALTFITALVILYVVIFLKPKKSDGVQLTSMINDTLKSITKIEQGLKEFNYHLLMLCQKSFIPFLSIAPAESIKSKISFSESLNNLFRDGQSSSDSNEYSN